MSERDEKDAPFHVGQTVWMSNWRMRREPRKVEVVKVARKYATVLVYGREEKFDRVTGQAPGESGWYIETNEQRAEKEALAEVHARLKAVGFRSTHDFPRALSLGALSQIASIAERDLAAGEPA